MKKTDWRQTDCHHLETNFREREKYFNKDIYFLVTSGAVHCSAVSASDY